MDRFQAITGIGQGARHDHAHGIIEKGRTHLRVYIDILDISTISITLIVFDHYFPLQILKVISTENFILALRRFTVWHSKTQHKTESRHKKDTKNETLWLRVLT